MRAHVELVDEKDLLWHVAELPHGEGEARQKHLCYDEENGAASLRVDFDTDWRRGPGLHTAQTEWFVLEGEVQFGEHRLTKGGYWCAPTGIATPEVQAKAGTKILLFREYADWGFAPGAGNAADAKLELVVKATETMDWFDVEDPHNGSPMDFTRGGTPVPGLFIKLLYRDPLTGFYTRLIKAKPGWREHPLAHHPVFEEAYCLEGEFDYNYGFMTEGQYFFRPAGVRHGDFTAGKEDGCTWILRCDGDLVDWYTENARVEMKGDPVNWGDDFPGSEPPVHLQPVRSRTVGAWKDPTYQ